MDVFAAEHDELTGLPNLIAYLRTLVSLTAVGQPFGVVVFGMDRCHTVNQTQGREAGDFVLKAMAGLLTDSGAAAYRLGCDEFAVVWPGATADEAEAAGSRLLKQVSARLRGCTVSAAACAYPQPAPDLGSLLTMVEADLARAKLAGPGGLCANRETGILPGRGLMTELVRRVVETGDLLSRMRRLAHTDPVSSLPNQRAAEAYLAEEMARSAPTREFSILLVDGDCLKQFNDRSGYEAGDEWIRGLGKTLQACLRSFDSVARWRSGDEFLVILPGTGAEGAAKVAERMRQAVAMSWDSLPVTVSIGVATYPADGADAAALCKAAAQAVRRAKREGKNRVVPFGRGGQ